ncbi:hypothetical protein M3Y94_00673500 [Aphelenchoides besseyi]|nr:hypothetical protein M3Y94_00673500 [Aphelenchoides besseyi]
MRIPVLFLLIPIIVHGYRLNEPRVLLPFDSKNLVSYLLEVKEPTGGCFFWKSSRPHIVSVEPVNQNRNCADSAIITARSRHLTDQSAVILATDHAGEISLNCDVRVDVIDRIEIFSTANFLFLEGPPAKIEIHGFNARGNQFSTLGSIPFDWQLKSLESNRRPLRIVSFSDSHYQVPFGIAELEAQKKRGAEILLEGIQTGKTKLTATLSELTTSTELFVVQKAILIPSEDLWVPIGAKINYSVVILKQSGSESVVLPSEQYKLKVSDSSICTWNDAKSQLEAKKIGHLSPKFLLTSLKLSVSMWSKWMRFFFVVDKNENWHFQLNQDYKIEVRIRDVNGNELTIPENAKFKTQFTTSDHLRILDSAQNGTFFHVRPLKTGTTGIESEFVELVGEDGQSQKFASKITATQKIEINPPVKVEPTVLIFPPDSQYEWRLKASGGSGIFSFFSEQKHIAKIAEDGLIRTSGQLGRTIIHVEDYRNALNFDLATVLVLTPVQIDFSESRREAEIGSELTLNLRLLARDEETNAPLPYSDCRGADLRFAVENPKIFEIDFKKEPQIPTNGCRTVTLRAMASGDTKLIVWFGTLTTQFEISAYAPLRVISAAPLLSLGSEYAVEFTGGPRPWLLEPNGFFFAIGINE